MLPHEAVHMAGMGLLTAVVAPAIVLLGRRHLRWSAGWLTLPLFVVAHATIMLVMEMDEPPRVEHLALDTVLVAAAVGFWLPVLGLHRLDDVGRCAYLFLAAPSLDLPAVVVVARGDAVGGLSMIVAMLPIGLFAVVLTWRVMVAEERAVRQFEDSLAREAAHADA